MKARVIYLNEIEIEGKNLDDILHKFHEMSSEELYENSDYHSLKCVEDADTFETLYEQ